jgi:hypothetical protein
VTSRGEPKQVTLDAPPGLPQNVQRLVDGLRDSLRNLTCLFPEEAVGENAKWEVKTALAGPITMVQKATYTLRNATDKGVAFDVTLAQEAPPQAINLAQALPQGTTMRLSKYAAVGSGTSKVTLAKITPTSSMKLTSTTEMDISAGTQPHTMSVEVTMDVRFKPSK